MGLTGCDNSDDWAGALIELFAIDVMGPNGPTQGVRIRRPATRTPKKGRPTKPAPPVLDDPLPGDEVGF